MQNILIKSSSGFKQISLEQLRLLAQGKLIATSTPLMIDERHCFFGEVEWQILDGAETLEPPGVSEVKQEVKPLQTLSSQMIGVELNGRIKNLSLTDLRLLVNEGFVDASTPICVEGEDCLYCDISEQIVRGVEHITPPNKVQIIAVEMNGNFRQVSLEQLRELDRLGFLGSLTRVNIDGLVCRKIQIAAQLASDTRRIKTPKKNSKIVLDFFRKVCTKPFGQNLIAKIKKLLLK